MKKRVWIIVAIIIVCILGGIKVYDYTHAYVDLNGNNTQIDVVASQGGFNLNTKKEVTIQYSSSVKEGNLTIQLMDESKNVILSIEPDQKGSKKIELEQGSYILRVESDGFAGSYHVKIK